MATPHITGLAALLKSAHPAWSASDIRSAIVNSAQQGILRDSATNVVTNDAVIVGAGLADAEGALGAKVGLDPVSISFGSIPGTSGQSKSATLRLRNISASAQTYSVTINDDWADGVLFGQRHDGNVARRRSGQRHHLHRYAQGRGRRQQAGNDPCFRLGRGDRACAGLRAHRIRSRRPGPAFVSPAQLK